MDNPLPVAGYYRVSLARDNMHSPELYEDEIRRYCTYRRLTLARVYSDVDYSAFRGAKERPALNELIDDRKSYSAVIVPKLSRFGRSMKQLVKLFEIFDSDNIPLVFLDMNLDTSTSQGRLLRHILAAFAEYESDVKADYTRATHRRIRAEGKAWGLPPFGYRKGDEPCSWVIDEDAAGVVLSAYSDYAAGMSANAIAALFNEAGIPTARGLKWKGQAIGTMLDNPAYAGLSLLDGEFVAGRWEPIIGPGLWNAVRARRAADPRRRGNLGKPRRKGAYLLSGLVWCGLCDCRMTHTVNPRDHVGIYHCHGEQWGTWTGCSNMRLRAHLGEPVVVEAFLARCAFTILTETGNRAGSPRTLWSEASLSERQRLLRLVIDRVVVTPKEPRPPGDVNSTLRHDLRIEWKSEVPARDALVVLEDEDQRTEAEPRQRRRHGRLRDHELAELSGDDEPEPAVPPEAAPIPAERKSWAEFRRERLLFR